MSTVAYWLWSSETPDMGNGKILKVGLEHGDKKLNIYDIYI